MGRGIKIAKTPTVDTGYQNGLGLGIVGGEVDTDPIDTVVTIGCSANINGVVYNSMSPKRPFIVRQRGARKFLVSIEIDPNRRDSTNTAICILSNKNDSSLEIGEMNVPIITASLASKYLMKFNDTFGVAFDGTPYHLTFNAPDSTPPTGSVYEIAQVSAN